MPRNRRSRASFFVVIGVNSAVAQPVADDRGAAPRYADLLAVDLGLVGADVDEGVGHPFQHALDAEVEHAFERALVVMQAAAMGRVDAGDRPAPAEPCGDQPPVGATLGAMAMQDVGDDLAEMLEHPAHRHEIAQRDAAPHRKARGAERELRADRCDELVLETAAGGGVADDADVVAGFGLGIDEVDDVPKDAADRRAHDVDDLQPIRPVHDEFPAGVFSTTRSWWNCKRSAVTPRHL